MTGYEEVLAKLSSRTAEGKHLLDILDAELALPNIPMPTMGGEVFWNNIAEYNGWKLQQNMFTHHARILDSNNVRIAWGTINGMKKAMNRLVEGLHSYEPSSREMSGDRRNAMEELKALKELLDMGAISNEEYRQKKAELMKRI